MEERRNGHSKSKGNKDKNTIVNDFGFLNELALVVLLTSIACATRFYRLGEPNEVACVSFMCNNLIIIVRLYLMKFILAALQLII